MALIGELVKYEIAIALVAAQTQACASSAHGSCRVTATSTNPQYASRVRPEMTRLSVNSDP
jgi:hypothetical protein